MTCCRSFNAIVPMACVVAAALAAMVAEAFRAPGERMPIAPLGAIGLMGAAASSLLLWNRNATSFDLVVADNFGLFVTGVLIVVGIVSLAISSHTVEQEGLPQGEYYALLLFSLAGMMLMATATDLLVDLPRARSPVARGLRAHRNPARFARGSRSLAQLLPPRRVLQRVLSLRHRASPTA